MRVLQVVPDLGVGGAERMVTQLSISLAYLGVNVKVISLYDRKSTMNEVALDAGGIDSVYLSKSAGFDGKMFRSLGKELGQWQPDVIHTHRYVLRYLLPHLPISKRRWVHTVHNVAHKEVDRVGRVVHRAAFAAGVVPVAIAGEVARSVRTLYGLREVPLIPNGIDLTSFGVVNGVRLSWREREGIADDRILFVAVGRLTVQKNHALLLEAFSRVADALPQAQLLIAGEGELRPELERKVAEKRLGGRVRLLGVRSDVADVLAASDVFVMSSDWEGHPLSVMEALAAGLPAISTDVGGVPELVVSEETGLLVAAGDVEAFSESMLRLGQSEELRTRMGQAARTSSRRFSVAKMTERYLTLYEQR